MSIIVTGITLPIEESIDTAYRNAAKICGVSLNNVIAREYKISVDARGRRPKFVRSVELDGIENEKRLAEALNRPDVRLHERISLSELAGKTAASSRRPAVVGFGPAGMFAALTLAMRGMRPVVIERGEQLEKRDVSVAEFENGGRLDPESNIQFGEGGAGAYSDGKLTTRINDPYCEAVLQTFIDFGAPEEIMRSAKPHIGTDLLKPVVTRIRKRIEELGGRLLFSTKATGVLTARGRICGVRTDRGDIETDALILAPGHSARDTMERLLMDGIELLPKPFSMGVRIEHLQEALDASMYGAYAGNPLLPPAEYQLSFRQGEHACYSFCMCPGGSVVAAASEAGGVVTNGMSRHARNGKNANAALAVPVPTEAFPEGPLGGIDAARAAERRAFALGGGDYTAPAQLVKDLLAGRPSNACGAVRPTYPRGVRFGAVGEALPAGAEASLKAALEYFPRLISCFGDGDAVLTAPETRTSSPVRIPRNEGYESVSVGGLYPCGEGAGYAGGIMSAAVDGMRIALGLD